MFWTPYRLGLATVSALALGATTGTAHAQVAAYQIATVPPRTDFKPDLWTVVWVEGGLGRAGGEPLRFGNGVKAGGFEPGPDTAFGFAFHPTASLWSVQSEFRFGAASGRQAFSTDGTSGPAIGVPATGRAKDQEDHWLADFEVGRDVDIGSLKSEIHGGLRIASIEATTRARASYTIPGSINSCGSVSGTGSGVVSTPPSSGCITSTPAVPGAFTLKQTSRFVGAGPRFAVESVLSIDRRWAVEGDFGAAVLIGERSLKASATGGAADFAIGPINNSQTTGVINLDGSLGLDFKMTPNAVVTFGYRVDSYFGALRTMSTIGHAADHDRYYAGPMLRLTFSG